MTESVLLGMALLHDYQFLLLYERLGYRHRLPWHPETIPHVPAIPRYPTQ